MKQLINYYSIYRSGSKLCVFILINFINIFCYSQAKEEVRLSDSLKKIGDKYLFDADYENALNYYQMSILEAEKVDYKKGVAACYGNIGTMHARQGNYQEALEFQNKATDIFRQIEDKGGLSNGYLNIGNINKNQGNLYKALEYYTLSSKLRKEINDTKGVSSCNINIGAVYNKQYNYEKALEYFLNSIKIFEETKDLKNLSICYNNVGNTYASKKDYPNALTYYFKALKIKEELGDKIGIAINYNNIGGVYVLQNDFQKASEYLNAALRVKRENEDNRGVALCFANLSSLYIDIDLRTSIAFADSAIVLSKEIGDLDNLRLAYDNIAQAYALNGQPEKAVMYLSRLNSCITKHLELNYFTLSEQEKELYFNELEKNYMLYYEFASLNAKQFPELLDTAYNNTLSIKGLALKSVTAMRLAILRSADTSLINHYEHWLHLKKQISKAYENGKEVKEIENQTNEIERELIKKSKLFSDFDKTKNLNWKQVQAGLKKGEAAIEFVNFKSRLDTIKAVKYLAILIKKDSKHPEIISLCTEDELKEILGAFQGNNMGFVNKVYGTKQCTQTALYTKIWEPIEKHLTDVKTVYYSPSGLLHKVSFAALCKDKNNYLCDRYKLNQQSSTGKIALPDNSFFDEKDPITLMGGIKYNTAATKNEIWPYLPGTLNETENIDKLLKEKNIEHNYFVGDNASETIFKENAKYATIIHMSTHGFFYPDPEQVREETKKNVDSVKTKETSEQVTFRGITNYANWSFVNNKNPLMRSGLVLAGANDVWDRDPMTEGEDGILTAQEVCNLNLNKTKLVVLSACETGLGDIKGSEGVYGLQRALKMAGAKFIVMSLWQVPDKETTEFMELFYSNMIKSQDIRRAFTLTQKSMHKKYDPYYWAAFTLVE